MPVRNANWYNLQSTRNYPLDDRATTTGDDGERLPEDILVDCHLRWPDTVGQFAFVSGVTITDRLLTVLIQAAESVTAAGGFTPLAAVTLVKPIDRHRHYNVSPLLPGVGGYLVFGDVDENFSARFTTPQQGLLHLKCARPYDPLPIPTLRKLGLGNGLEGLVNIVAGADLEIVKEEVELQGGNTVDALVIRLLQQVTARNVLQTYLGPCDVRPESRTCNKEGIETVNGEGPDCDGNLNIIFEGLTEGPYDGCGSLDAGTTIDHELGIEEVCVGQQAERFLGHDLCIPSSSESEGSQASESLPSEPPPVEPSEPGVGSESEASVYCPWPFITSFDYYEMDGFVVKSGNFSFESADSPDEVGDEGPVVALAATSGSRRNVAVWDDPLCPIDNTLEKRCQIDVQTTREFYRRDGGMIINWHIVNPITNPHEEYFVADVDARDQVVRIRRFNGAYFVIEQEVSAPKPILENHWYRIVVETADAGGGLVAIDATFTGVTNPSWGSVSISLTTSKFKSPDGRFGVGSSQALARFSYFQLGDR